MGLGIFLIVVGAILALAVRQGDSPTIDLDVVGLILMAAGAAIIWYARRGNGRERVVTRIDDLSDPHRPTHTVIERATDGALETGASDGPHHPTALPDGEQR